ncbi:universal stress protein [Halorientalis brevis]|uniref:Universal stress protein n=1 Tax=Halorientalis brevis TaxID=1126241 RepID=A0ABD6CCI8_9EURY|nr:universal stress protein [Halorientalis brevis]
MIDQILFPTDGSEAAADVFEFAQQIALEHDATLTVLNVADTNRDSVTQISGEVIDALETEGEQIVQELADDANPRVSIRTDVVQGEPRQTIVEYGERIDADLIVMPTHGRRGLERVLLGSVTERVVSTATVPVLAVNPGDDGAPSYPCDDVLVPTDGSEGATRALRTGVDLAKATGATLHVLTVVETASLGFDARSMLKDEELESNATETITEATDVAEASLDDVRSSIRHGRPYREIRAYVDDNDVDLIAMGTHGRTDFSRYLLGSVANKLLRSSPVPVLTVRADADD